MWSNIWNILNTVILYQNLSNISNDSSRYHDYHQNATTTTIATISTSISERQSHTTIRSHSHQQFTRRNGIVHISDDKSNEIRVGDISGGHARKCPKSTRFGKGHRGQHCQKPTDPNNRTASLLEKWFTKEMFNDLFPKANLGWGPHICLPYSYEAFAIAARYFPNFGTESPNSNYTVVENTRRDLAAFFAHAIQETGENNIGLYSSMKKSDADDCFYRGGFFNWFEGGPVSSLLHPQAPGHSPRDGDNCTASGRYCASSTELDYWFPCSDDRTDNSSSTVYHRGCYFGRGAIQISYNYNYGQFEQWLRSKNIIVDLLSDPNLIITKMDPPLAMMASIWFYMTPQPPKPAMHDIVLGNWKSGDVNSEKGYFGPIFGPTSLIINNECNGEDAEDPGGPGESRRIKAFKWFCNYFNVPVGDDKHLSCKDMPEKLEALRYNWSWQPDWANAWRDRSCDCQPAGYGGMVPYYQAEYYPEEFVATNERNRLRCIFSIYDNPQMYNMNNETSACLNHKLVVHVDRDGVVVEYDDDEMTVTTSLNATITDDND